MAYYTPPFKSFTISRIASIAISNHITDWGEGKGASFVDDMEADQADLAKLAEEINKELGFTAIDYDDLDSQKVDTYDQLVEHLIAQVKAAGKYH